MGLLDEEIEYYYLVACIVEGESVCINTSGTYGAWYLQELGTARIKKYELFRLGDDESGENPLLQRGRNRAVKTAAGRHLYVDRPGQAPSIFQCHVLETAAGYGDQRHGTEALYEE